MKYKDFVNNIDALLEKKIGKNHGVTYSMERKAGSKYCIFTFDFTNFQSSNASANALFDYIGEEKIITANGKEMFEFYLLTGDIMESIIGWM